MKKIFLSTSIPYVNAAPHIGHALEFVEADAMARRHRILGDDIFFLSGSDENSLKNVQRAEREGLGVKLLVDQNTERFRDLGRQLDISLDDFIRTTEERHILGAQKLWQACAKDIYRKKYSGLYCVGCEEFYKEEELVGGLCPEHGTKPELIEEDDYFFKLSRYGDRLFELIQKDEIKILPESRKNEVLSFINSGLQDFCISRSNERARGWGIDVPGDPDQKMWVWFDALSNYINALGYASDREAFEKFWQQSDSRVHAIGKGIIRFHAVYWPAMLLSAGLNLPTTIFVHGYVTADGKKMSKSLGNTVDPFEVIKKYGVDGTRYFLLREIPVSSDGDFSYEKCDKRYNSDLASGLGNLFSRTLAMVEKAGLAKGFRALPNDFTKDEVDGVRKDYEAKFVRFNEALESIWTLVSSCDRYIDAEKPWEAVDPEKQREIFSNLLYSLKAISEMIEPFLPGTAGKMREQLGEENGVFNIRRGEALFPRI
jgi:methionyl-tRNA synthetase